MAAAFPRRPAGGTGARRPAAPVSATLARARRVARQRSSTALYLLASAFLATSVLRANAIRHEIVSFIAAPAHASTPANDAAPTEYAGPAAGPASAMADTGTAPIAAAPDRSAESTTAAAPKVPAPAAMAPPKGSHVAFDQATPSSGPGGQAGCLDGAFLAAARERERELDAQDMAMAGRRRELEVVEKRVAAQLAELATQQQALQAAFGQAENAAEDEAMQLVSIYERMKPKQAAQIFDRMPPEIAAGFVRRMRKTSSALIMANMDPEKAFSVSLLLAGRSGAVRQE